MTLIESFTTFYLHVLKDLGKPINGPWNYAQFFNTFTSLLHFQKATCMYNPAPGTYIYLINVVSTSILRWVNTFRIGLKMHSDSKSIKVQVGRDHRVNNLVTNNTRNVKRGNFLFSLENNCAWCWGTKTSISFTLLNAYGKQKPGGNKLNEFSPLVQCWKVSINIEILS